MRFQLCRWSLSSHLAENTLRTLRTLRKGRLQTCEGLNGHAFFRKSSWASSDIFLASLSSLPAGKRGLVRDPDSAVWHFPPDYPERIARITNR